MQHPSPSLHPLPPKRCNASIPPGEADNSCLPVACGSYESPEVQLGLEYDEKTDIWGLGCVLCDMTTLR